MKFLVFFLSLLFGYFVLFVCMINCWNPFYIDFGNGYYISSDKDYGVDDLEYEYSKSYHQNRCICIYDSLRQKDSMVISPDNLREVILGRHISQIESDNDFIILQRKPKDVFDSLYVSALKNDSLAFRGFNSDYDYSFKYFFKTIEYWIIDKHSNDMYGPLPMTRYYSMRDQLGVSEKLRLPFENQSLEIEKTILMIKIIFILILPLLFSIIIVVCFNKYRGNLSHFFNETIWT